VILVRIVLEVLRDPRAAATRRAAPMAAEPRMVASICPFFCIAATFTSGYRARRRRSKSAPGGNVCLRREQGDRDRLQPPRIALPPDLPQECANGDKYSSGSVATLYNVALIGLGISSLDLGRFRRPFLCLSAKPASHSAPAIDRPARPSIRRARAGLDGAVV
jgi:hypothetical protein